MTNIFEEKYKASAEPWSADDYARYGDYYRKIEEILSAYPFGDAARMLDIGCGTGHLTSLLAKRFGQAVGVDIAASAVARANDRYKTPALTFAEGDLFGSHWQPEGKFDLILISQVVYYYSFIEARAALLKAHSLLAPEGMVLLSHTIPENSPWTREAFLYLLNGYFHVEHMETFETHFIIAARKKMKTLVLTLDVELCERSCGQEKLAASDIEAHYIAPLETALTILRRHGVKASLFLEVNQLKLFSRYFEPQFGHIKSLLRQARDSGLFDFQLHVHANWDLNTGACFADGVVHYGPQRIDTAQPETLVNSWLEVFSLLELPPPVAFRGGKYRPITDERLVRCLQAEGVFIHSNLIPGALIVADDGDMFDFRSDTLPVAPRPHVGQVPGVIELPIASAQGNSLSLDYTDIGNLQQSLADLTFFPGPKVLVSHPKDIDAAKFEARIVSLKAFSEKQGFIFQTVGDIAPDLQAANVEDIAFAKLRFDSRSLDFIRHIVAHYTVSPAVAVNLGAGSAIMLRRLIAQEIQSVGNPPVTTIRFDAKLARGHMRYTGNTQELTVGIAPTLAEKIRPFVKLTARRVLYALPEGIRSRLLDMRARNGKIAYIDPCVISIFG